MFKKIIYSFVFIFTVSLSIFSSSNAVTKYYVLEKNQDIYTESYKLIDLNSDYTKIIKTTNNMIYFTYVTEDEQLHFASYNVENNKLKVLTNDIDMVLYKTDYYNQYIVLNNHQMDGYYHDRTLRIFNTKTGKMKVLSKTAYAPFSVKGHKLYYVSFYKSKNCVRCYDFKTKKTKTLKKLNKKFEIVTKITSNSVVLTDEDWNNFKVKF